MYRLLIPLLLMLMAVSAPAQDDISPALLDDLTDIEAYVTEMRGLTLQTPLTRVFPDRETVSAFLYDSINTQLTDEIAAQSMGFYTSFDLLPAETDLRGVYFRLIEDQIGGYYDPEDKTMNTILISGDALGDTLPPLESTVYAHEFVHTLQDQHFDLQAIGLSEEGLQSLSTDQILAIQALVEGDATLITNFYTNELQRQNPLAVFQILGSTLSSGAMTLPEGTPPILLRELYFPYNQGLTFVSTLYGIDGYAAIDAAFSDLPQSTEHILHPQTYLNGDQPIPVALDDVADALGDDWTLLHTDTLGEFYLRAFLDTQLDVSVYPDAAAGWGGDRYQVYHHADGHHAMVTALVWDTPADRDEFAAAFDQYGEARFGTPSTDGCWTATDEALCVSQTAADEVLFSWGPSEDAARALIARAR